MDKNKDLMYHYCNIETFNKIIESKTLWLSDSSCMNDENEIIWIDNVLSDAIMELKNKLNSDELKKLNDIQTAYRNLPHKKHYFISFSEKRNILNQWKRYGDNKKGIAIGFSLRYCFDSIGLASKSQRTSRIPGGDLSISTQRLGYEPVVYDGKTEIKELLLDSIHDQQIDIFQAALSIKELASTLKDPKYKLEEETRITYTPENPYQDDMNSSTDEILNEVSHQQIRRGEKGNVPYYILGFDNEYMSLLIPEIVLGSNCKLKISDVKNFLLVNGFNHTFVSKSSNDYKQVLK